MNIWRGTSEIIILSWSFSLSGITIILVWHSYRWQQTRIYLYFHLRQTTTNCNTNPYCKGCEVSTFVISENQFYLGSPPHPPQIHKFQGVLVGSLRAMAASLIRIAANFLSTCYKSGIVVGARRWGTFRTLSRYRDNSKSLWDLVDAERSLWSFPLSD